MRQPPKVGEKCMALKVGGKCVALKVGEKAASHLTPLHAPVKKAGKTFPLHDLFDRIRLSWI